MDAFAYVAPTTLEAALAVLAERAAATARTQVLAGGTDLLVQLRSVDRDPRTLLDVKRIPELGAISVDAEGLLLGAAVPAFEVARHRQIAAHWPGLVEAVDLIGSSQIQGRASVGGNLCNASPAGDTIPALVANGARCRIAGATGTREQPVEDFVTGVGRNALAPGELLVALRFPAPAPRSADAYLRFTPRSEMDIAVAGAGVRVALDADGTVAAARVSIGAVATRALHVPEAGAALVGSRGEPEALAALADACSAAARPITDKRGTEAYRRRVVGVLARRAAAQALARAAEGDAS